MIVDHRPAIPETHVANNRTLNESLTRIVGLRAVALSQLLQQTNGVFYQLQYAEPKPDRYTVEHYSPRTFQVRDADRLVAVTVYKRGAEEVRRQLQARDADVVRWRSLAIALVSYLDKRSHG